MAALAGMIHSIIHDSRVVIFDMYVIMSFGSKEQGEESEESEMSDSGEDEKLTEEEREKKRHR